jgi:hypothetical protein
MNDANKTPVWKRSPLCQFFVWLFSWRGMRSILIFLACVAVLIGILYVKEDWQGHRQWNKYRQQLEAQGEKLDLKMFIPKSVPDDQNFAATPLVQSWFQLGDPPAIAGGFFDDDYSAASGMVTSSDKNKGYRHFLDLEAWALAFAAVGADPPKGSKKVPQGELDLQNRAQAAPRILDAMESVDAVLAELRAAAKRPAARYPITYNLDNPWSILLPHLAKLKAASQRLQLKACAHLAANQPDSALKDVELMLYLADSIKDETFLISHLVRFACVHLALQPVWEGLAERRWSEAQLGILQSRLQTNNFLADTVRSLEAEQAAGVLTIELVQRNGLEFLQTLQGSQSPAPPGRALLSVLTWVIPSGWYDMEKLNYCQFRHLLTGTAVDPVKKRIIPSQVEANNKRFESAIRAPGLLGPHVSAVLNHRILAGLLLPALGRISCKTASAQTALDEAVLACALERHRLANGKFPESLQALSPQFIRELPHDVITGAPFKYQRSGDGEFILYSVGWDEDDDGGTPGNLLFAENHGDWVWSYAAE